MSTEPNSTDSTETTFPYGRKGYPMCYSTPEKPGRDTVEEHDLVDSPVMGDNDVKWFYDRRVAALYEAPTETDPARGHFSIWVQQSNGRYGRVYGMSGDDGMIYEMFQESSEYEVI